MNSQMEHILLSALNLEYMYFEVLRKKTRVNSVPTNVIDFLRNLPFICEMLHFSIDFKTPNKNKTEIFKYLLTEKNLRFKLRYVVKGKSRETKDLNPKVVL